MFLFDKNGKINEIDEEKVWTIESRDTGTLFRIGADHFCPPMNLKELAEVYNRLGFHQIDRATLLNLNLVDPERVVGNKYYIDHHAFTVSRRNELSIKQLFSNFR